MTRSASERPQRGRHREPKVWAQTGATAAKHLILSRYLDAWFAIMGRSEPRLLVIDGFAGPGTYTGGEPGSPLLMLDSAISMRNSGSVAATVVFVFVEEEERRLNLLRGKVARRGPLTGIEVHFVRGAFHEFLGEALERLRSEGKSIAPTFAFIDPFGYAMTELNVTSGILGFRACEVLIYVPLPFVARFVASTSPPADALNRLFGDERWRAARGLPTSEATEQMLHDLLRDRLLEDCKFVRSFEIVGSGSNNGARLFFGTNHRLGLARMKDAMWAVDPAGGTTFRDSTLVGQETLFDPEPDYHLLEKLLRKRFGTDPFTIEAAADFTLYETPFRHNGHLKRNTLGRAEKAGRIAVVASPRKRSRGQYPDGTRLRFLS